MSKIIQSLRAASTGQQVAVLAAALVILAILLFAGVSFYNNWQKHRTAEKLQKNESTVATGQRDLGEALTKKEVETVRHESTITIRTQAGAARVEAVPVGSQLDPLLDELCGLYDYPSDPGCASRVRRAGDGEAEVRSGSVADE